VGETARQRGEFRTQNSEIRRIFSGGGVLVWGFVLLLGGGFYGGAGDGL
jgi:hypothetical protein